MYISYHWDAAPNRYICLTAAGVNWELTCHDYYVGMSANPEHGVLVKVSPPVLHTYGCNERFRSNIDQQAAPVLDLWDVIDLWDVAC